MTWIVYVSAVGLVAGLAQHHQAQRKRAAALREWRSLAEKRGLAFTDAPALRLTGHLSGFSVQIALGRLTYTAVPWAGARLTLKALTRLTLGPADFEAIRSGSPELQGGPLAAFGRDPWLRRALTALLPAGDLRLQDGVLILETRQVAGEKLDALLDQLLAAAGALERAAPVQITAASPHRALARRLSLQCDSAHIFGQRDGVTVTLRPAPDGYALRAVIPGFPARLTVSRSGTGGEARPLGDLILDGALTIETPIAEQVPVLKAALQGGDIHGELLTVICEHGGRIERGCVHIAASEEGLGAALEDAVSLATALSRSSGPTGSPAPSTPPRP